MNVELQQLITSLKESELVKLAVAVQQDLADESNSDVLAQLNPEGAEAFLVGMAGLQQSLTGAGDLTAVAAIARTFLEILLRAGVFDEIITSNAMSGGVRAIALQDLVNWFKGSFNIASLIGIKFEYISENKVVTKTKTGSTETTRTIKVVVGK
jgi:hypothetical protein